MSEADQELLERDEVPEKYRWKLEDIYASEEAWQQDYDDVKSRLPSLEAYQGKLGDGADSLLAALKLRDEIELKTGLLFAYAKMRKDENTANPKYQALEDKARGLIVDVRGTTSYIVPELLAITQDRVEQFIEEKEELWKILCDKRHTCSLLKRNSCSPAWERLPRPPRTFSG